VADRAELRDVARGQIERILRTPAADHERLVDDVAQVLADLDDDAVARGRSAVLAQVADLLRDARCGYRDPGLRMLWGRQRKALLNEALDAAHAAAVSPT
jgi:hypothetical protein